jgi:hypothetical protein
MRPNLGGADSAAEKRFGGENNGGKYRASASVGLLNCFVPVRLRLLTSLCLPAVVLARSWTFSDPVPVAPVAHDRYQGHPAAVWGNEDHLVVAWEDRRAGHTRLFHSGRTGGRGFDPERQLNEHVEPTGSGRGSLRLGSGAMRAALAANGEGAVRAVWLDKRNPSSGSAVWGAVSTDGGRTFGPNQIMQDELGAAVPQWHAALAGGKAGFVAAWDDSREGWDATDEPGDVLLSWETGSAWGPDLVVPGASGEGYQGSPAIALDPPGGLHLLWIDRPDLSSPTRLRYLRGQLNAS